jgi:tRNA (guanine-N7-)-methyltransferase
MVARRFDLSKPNLTKKLARFAELTALPNSVEIPSAYKLDDFHLKGKWAADHFKNDLPVTLELACGKGEYSVGQAKLFKNRNFIGVDIKGNRMWKGAKEALAEGLKNVAYLRTRIDHIENLFTRDEVDEIWIIFPDPQKEKERKRLTSPLFLDRYRKILKTGGTVNLKTDNYPLYEYTMEVISEQGLEVLDYSMDVYSDLDQKKSEYLNIREDILRIRTFYENMWLEQGLKINYISFKL